MDLSADTLIRGRRCPGGARVTVAGEPLAPDTPLRDTSLCLHNHSPAGPDWGHDGSGPAQLALTVLLLATGLGRGRPVLLPLQELRTRRRSFASRRGSARPGRGSPRCSRAWAASAPMVRFAPPSAERGLCGSSYPAIKQIIVVNGGRGERIEGDRESRKGEGVGPPPACGGWRGRVSLEERPRAEKKEPDATC